MNRAYIQTRDGIGNPFQSRCLLNLYFKIFFFIGNRLGINQHRPACLPPWPTGVHARHELCVTTAYYVQGPAACQAELSLWLSRQSATAAHSAVYYSSSQTNVGRYPKKESAKKHKYAVINVIIKLELVNKMESILENSKVEFKTKMRKI